MLISSKIDSDFVCNTLSVWVGQRSISQRARDDLAREAITRVAGKADLSKDTHEVVTRALAD